MTRYLAGCLLLVSTVCLAEPAPTRTEILGGFTGPGAELPAENLAPNRIEYYGTDLGWTYVHDGELVVLFGDTMKTPEGREADGTVDYYDDTFGTVDLTRWGDPATIGPDNLPLVKIGQVPGSVDFIDIDPGIAMEGFKTPVAGFSNGEDEYGLFYTGKPMACREDADCGEGLSCDTGLGYVGVPFDQGEGQTFGCLEGGPGCVANTLPGEGASGLCIDTGSSIWAAEGYGRINAIAQRHRVGLRDPQSPGRYGQIREWRTNRFLNPALRSVQDYDPARGVSGHDWTPAGVSGDGRKLLLWGRPAFIGVGAKNRPANLYFAWVDMPEGEDYEWTPNYFTGLDENGNPQYSTDQAAAAALDLDAAAPGVQPDETIDVVDQVSVAWVEPLQRWVMFFGGGMSNLPLPPFLVNCGVLEVFTGSECGLVEIGDGAFWMRTAEHPWGPWSEPRKLIAAGDPGDPTSGQYAPGGVLFHPRCDGADCVKRTPARESQPEDYGFFYSSIIVPQWISANGDGADVLWLASTWNPYRVILLRTHIEP